MHDECKASVGYLQSLLLLQVFLFCFLHLCIQALTDFSQLASLCFVIHVLTENKALDYPNSTQMFLE